MNLRELMIDRILFEVSAEELVMKHFLTDDDVAELSDLDLLELYETAIVGEPV